MENNQQQYFNSFKTSIAEFTIPVKFALMQADNANELCVLAAKELQNYLQNQKEWQHNFGLTADVGGQIIGKMFGVLVVQNQNNEVGYLAAFSGKLAGGNHHHKFVPPVFDTLAKDSFLNKGMEKLALLSVTIKNLEIGQQENYQTKINQLKINRKNLSIDLQNQLFESYHFLNQSGEEKSLIDLFINAGYKNPPAGAGECAGPKLLQYAFQHQMKPLALTEFWWGQSPKSTHWKHKEFYPCCKEKCEPILKHMLKEL